MPVEFEKRVFNVDTEKEIILAGDNIESDWMLPPASTTMPVSDEKYIENVRSNCKLDLPNVNYEQEHNRTMVMVCGGASAKDFLEDIRRKNKDSNYDIFCSNSTHDWLIENDIIPHTEFIIDPKKGKISDIKKPHKDVRYVFGIACVPELFDKFKDYNVYKVFAYSGIGKKAGHGLADWQICQAFYSPEEFAPLEGGTMAGLRAMNLADILGYKTVEFYGFDSCFYETDKDGYPIYYAYDKSRAENIIEAKTEGGKIYQTTPVFASQARQFIKWKHRLEWMNFIIHGDSLTAEINRLDEEKNKPKGKTISDYMCKLNKVEHDKNKNFGAGLCQTMDMTDHVGRMAVLAGQFIRNYGDITMLDYGCGKKEFENRMPPINGLTLYNYDPCIDGLDEKPKPVDIVVCIDVLEHVEYGYLNDVLDELEKLTNRICYVSVCKKESSNFYSDGQNMHLLQENYDWWYPKLRKRFDVVEHQETKTHFNAVLQKKVSVGRFGKSIKQDPDEFKELLEEIDKIEPAVILEIGVLRGGIISHYRNRVEQVLGIDLGTHQYGLSEYPPDVIIGDSHDESTLQELKKRLWSDSIDVLFIDADHSYQGVKKDFEMYAPLVRKGGIIAFHDIVKGGWHEKASKEFKKSIKVGRLWNEIKHNYKHKEIVSGEHWAGIGILWQN
jgi:cephalosporin hydroxylase